MASWEGTGPLRRRIRQLGDLVVELAGRVAEAEKSAEEARDAVAGPPNNNAKPKPKPGKGAPP